MSSKTSIAGPSPKKRRTDPKPSTIGSKSPGTPSPKKLFHSKRYYSPKRKSPGGKASPRKIASQRRLVLSDDNGGPSSVLLEEEEERDGGEGVGKVEAYYSTNFKQVLSKCLLPSNPEHHVISEQEAALVQDFMKLESGLELSSRYLAYRLVWDFPSYANVPDYL